MRISTGAVALFSAFLAASGAGAQEAPIPAAPPPARRTITVDGDGEAHGRPDVARASLGVEAASPKVGPALESANARMRAVLAAIRSAGVADRDVRTTDFSVYFEPDPVPAGGASNGPPAGRFHVRNVVEVTIRDIARASDVLDAAFAAGANTASGIALAIDDPAPLREKAREAAVLDARRRAETLARAAGVTVGPVVAITESSGGVEPRPMAMRALAMPGGPPVEAGELSESVRVEVVYEIGPASPAKR